ncbi:hypothetical protein [Kocuria sabuli]|uniref:hypothetical protein n=1 Tax=Kocuria sabuli TaxID=3071448 RepID=UPI0034D60016
MDQIGWAMLRTENTHALTRDLQARQGRKAGADITAQVHSVQRSPLVSKGAAGALRKATQVSGVSDPNRRPGPGETAFHYGLGMLPGALYGVTRRSRPRLSTGYGSLYGLGLFVVMDETAAPLTGIASRTGSYPWQAHARGLVAHLVLGITTDTLLRATDRIWHTSRL